MPKVQVNGIDIYYEIRGTGYPLVLISGLGYTLWQWHKMIPGLVKHYRVIAFDNRGIGRTDKPAGPYSSDLLAEDTAGLLEALEVERAHVIGHSMGGFVAQALALNHPEKIDKLVLCATNFGGPNHIPVTPEAMAVLSDVSGDPIERFRRGIVVSCAPGFAEAHPEIITEWLEYRTKNPIEPQPYQAQMAIGLSLLSAPASFEGKLSSIQAPTLILFGEHDKVVPPQNANLLAEKIPNSKVQILPNAGHFFPLEVPVTAIDAITQFLG